MCAAKRLHTILLQDQSPGGAEKLIANFEAECMTWSKLRHPGVVQFLGVHLERNSRLPVLVIEKMDTSLRKYCESHGKEFPLHLKAFVLLQICQALAYLHGQNPPLVHHDLSPNNVLLNVVSFVTKLTDFGMSRAINPSTIIRKSSVKGTPAFMSPEALQSPPRYNEKLDVFSFGNIILSTITHEWPEPCHLTQYKGDQLIALDEFQRRERYVEMFTPQEKQLFLPTVRQCLENRPDKRPSSAVLVRELRRIESSLPSGSHVAAPIEQLQKWLSAKEEECRHKDEALKEKDEALVNKDKMILEKENVIKGKDDALQHLDMIIREQDEALTEKNTALSKQQDTIQALQASNQEQRTAIQNQQDTIQMQQAEIEQLRKQQDTIQALQASNQEQRTAIQNQQDTIQMQQAEIEQLRKQQDTIQALQASNQEQRT
ncbi:MAG: protein kinase, partial [Alphaproteobacteria bacterium]|nr:protein kinase [Alphaproteobacteria bacterium]